MPRSRFFLFVTLLALSSTHGAVCQSVSAQDTSAEAITSQANPSQAMRPQKMTIEEHEVDLNAPPPPQELMRKSFKGALVEMAKYLKIPEDSPEWTLYINQPFPLNGKSPAPQAAPKLPGSGAPIQHLRFESSSQFASEEEFNKHYQEQLATYQASSTQPQELDSKSASDTTTFQTQVKPKSIAICQDSNSSVLELPKSYVHYGIETDMVFFPGNPPFDPQVGIGAKVILIPYTDKEGDQLSASFSGTEIPCLPYRIRSLGDKVVYSQGADALRNYDANLKSKGTFDPTVRQYLKQNGFWMDVPGE